MAKYDIPGAMKDVPEEDEEGEVWSSRTEPAPKIPAIILAQVEEPCLPPEAFWDPEDLAGIPTPPDGGWGWMIVAASFFCNMVVDGIAYSFGIFLIHFVDYYKTPKGETAWVGSLLTGCYLTAGPLVSALTNKFGCRPVTIAGSIISACAFLLSTIAPSVRFLMFSYGIMGGIGFGLIYLPAIVSVGYYFSTRRAFATGIAVCGSGMGAFVFAPITQTLLDVYDWKGALVILAGFALNCMVFGALMRPLKADSKVVPSDPESALEVQCNDKESSVPLTKDSNAQDLVLNNEPGVQSTLNLVDGDSKVATKSQPVEDLHNSVDAVPAVGLIVTTESSTTQQLTTHLSGPKKMLAPPTDQVQNTSLGAIKIGASPLPSARSIKPSSSQVNMKDFNRRFTMPAVMPLSDNTLFPKSNNNYMEPRCSVRTDASWSVHGGVRKKKSVDNKKDLARPLYRKDIFYSGSITQLPEFQQSQIYIPQAKNSARFSIVSYVASVTSIPCSDGDSSEVTPAAENVKRKKKWWFSKCLPKSMVDTLKEVLDFSLLYEAPFLLACVANIFGMMGFYIPFVYLTDSSVMKGIDRDSAAFLISVLGITNLVGRLLFGWIVDSPKVKALDVNNMCLLISGVATFLLPFCYSYSAIVAASSVFSLFVSAYISLTSIILVDMVGLDKLTNSFGLLSLFRGAASIVGPPIAGTIFDKTQSYDIPFYLSGALLITSALFTFFVPYVTRRSNRHKSKSKEGCPNVDMTVVMAAETEKSTPENPTVELQSTVM